MQAPLAVQEHAAPAKAVNRLPLGALLTANAISGAGNAVTILAIPWFVLETTGSAARMGIVGAVEMLPIVLAGLFGGTLVDRIGYRRMSVISDFASGATVALIPTLYYTVGLAFWQLLALVLLGALLDAPGVTARRSFVPELAEAAGMPMARATGYFGAISRSTGLVGPPIAGVLIALVGAAPLLWIDAATFAVSAAMMLALVPSKLQPRPDPAEAPSSYRSDLADGFRWIRGNALIRTLIVMILVTNLIESPLLIVLTVYAREVLDSSIALGVLFSVFSVGAIAGSMASGAVIAKVPGRWILPVGFSGILILYGVLIVEPQFVVILAVSLLVGLLAGPLNPFLDTVFLERVPARMRGRVFGLRSALMMSAMPLGILAGGALISAAGIRTTLVIQVAAMLLAIGWMLVSPTLRSVGNGET
jgi:MFS family permease